MAPGKKSGKSGKSKKFSLKVALTCVQVTEHNTQRLNLSYKDFVSIPKCIEKLTGIQEVDLSRNWIRQIPRFTTNFIAITVLDLHSNKLENLPATLGILQNLLVMNLCDNLLRSLPCELGQLKNLQTLRLAVNQLNALPASIVELKELRYIGLSDNRFTHVPGCLNRLSKLEKVNMDRNPIWIRVNPEVVSKTFHLVQGSQLCEACLEKCRSFRRRLENQEAETGAADSCSLPVSDDCAVTPAASHPTLQ